MPAHSSRAALPGANSDQVPPRTLRSGTTMGPPASIQRASRRGASRRAGDAWSSLIPGSRTPGNGTTAQASSSTSSTSPTRRRIPQDRDASGRTARASQRAAREQALATQAAADLDARLSRASGLASAGSLPATSAPQDRDSGSSSAGPAPSDPPEVFVIVITGAPCAGKSEALPKLQQWIEQRGLRCLTVPEVATRVLQSVGGYDPAWAGTPQHVEFQRLLLSAQIQAEDTVLGFARMRGGRSVVLCDSGALSGAAYSSEAEWAAVLSQSGWSAEELSRRYSYVLRLQSLAEVGDGSRYETQSNPARFHSAAQARAVAPRLAEAYSLCRSMEIRVCDSIEEKVRHMAAAVAALLDVPGPHQDPPAPQDPAESLQARIRALEAQLRSSRDSESARRNNYATLSAALQQGHSLQPRGPDEPMDLSVDTFEDRVDTLDDEPFDTKAAQQQRMEALLADLRRDWRERQAIGVGGITPDLQAGATGRAYAALGIGLAGATPSLRTPFHHMGWLGRPFPARAPSNDRSLERHPAELRYFLPKGRLKAANQQRYIQLSEGAGGQVSFTTNDSPGTTEVSVQGGCRFAFLLGMLRLSWMLSVVDRRHPQFLPLAKLTAAQDYVLRLAILELEYEFDAVEQFDTQLQFLRLQGEWDFDAEIPAQLVAELGNRRPSPQQQCSVCGGSGHNSSSCKLVVGGSGTKRKAPRNPTSQRDRPCFEFKKHGKCSKTNCPYRPCNGLPLKAAGNGQ